MLNNPAIQSEMTGVCYPHRTGRACLPCSCFCAERMLFLRRLRNSFRNRELALIARGARGTRLVWSARGPREARLRVFLRRQSCLKNDCNSLRGKSVCFPATFAIDYVLSLKDRDGIGREREAGSGEGRAQPGIGAERGGEPRVSGGLALERQLRLGGRGVHGQ